jgi:hypothetical protein
LQVVAVKSPTLTVANGRAAEDDEEDEEEIVDVPYTYEVEEVHEQEVVKEEVVERTLCHKSELRTPTRAMAWKWTRAR